MEGTHVGLTQDQLVRDLQWPSSPQAGLRFWSFDSHKCSIYTQMRLSSGGHGGRQTARACWRASSFQYPVLYNIRRRYCQPSSTDDGPPVYHNWVWTVVERCDDDRRAVALAKELGRKFQRGVTFWIQISLHDSVWWVRERRCGKNQLSSFSRFDRTTCDRQGRNTTVPH